MARKLLLSEENPFLPFEKMVRDMDEFTHHEEHLNMSPPTLAEEHEDYYIVHLMKHIELKISRGMLEQDQVEEYNRLKMGFLPPVV